MIDWSATLDQASNLPRQLYYRSICRKCAIRFMTQLACTNSGRMFSLRTVVNPGTTE